MIPPLPQPPPPPSLLPATQTLDAPSETLIASFFGFDGNARALASRQFTQEALVGTLIDLMRDPDPKVRLAACSRFLTYQQTVLKLNGRITNLTQKEKSNGNEPPTTIRSASATQVLGPRPTATHLPPEAIRRTPAQSFNTTPPPEEEGPQTEPD